MITTTTRMIKAATTLKVTLRKNALLSLSSFQRGITGNGFGSTTKGISTFICWNRNDQQPPITTSTVSLWNTTMTNRDISNRIMSYNKYSTLPSEYETDDHQPHNSSNTTVDDNSIPWFPKHRSDIDQIIHRTIQASTTSANENSNSSSNSDQDNAIVTLSSDHPGFCDPIYRQRRMVLAQYAQQYHWDDNEHIPFIQYTPNETNVWTCVYDQMVPLIQQYACNEYKIAFHEMQNVGIYNRNHIPQQSKIYQYLYNKTQFRLRPVAGLLQSRDFLNALALRIFCSTQYIRHSSQPYYTPEPDICHELLGHVPLLSNPTFANLSQQIGIASLGASDDDIDRLAKCYWHSVEFGLCYDTDNDTKTKKAYGAGLLSSFGELQYACDDHFDGNNNHGTDLTNQNQPQLLSRPIYKEWDPKQASIETFPITTYQPIYYVAQSITDALHKLKVFCNTYIENKKSFIVQYNPKTERIDVQMK